MKSRFIGSPRDQLREHAAYHRYAPSLARSLRFELLEDRRILTAVSWTGGVSGNWNVAADWSNGVVPTSAADVTINTIGSMSIAINPGDAISVHSLTVGSKDSLSIVGGSLTTAMGLSNSGTITVAAGCNLTVNGSYSQAAGATLSMPGGGSMANPATNLATNFDFESPTAAGSATTPNGWGMWGTSYLSTQYAYSGAQSLQISGGNSGAAESFAATPGAEYTLSADAMTPATGPLIGNETGQLELLFYNASGTLLSSYSAPNLINVLTNLSPSGGPLAGSVGGQGWNHFSTSAVAPAGTAKAEAIITTQTNSGTGGGSVFWDNVQFGPSYPGASAFSAGSISNSGAMTVGPSNTVSTGDSFTQTSTGTLDIQLGGAPLSGAFGVLNVAGTATLAGALKADLVYGYSPSTTDTFTPMEFASESGAFSSYSLPSSTTYKFAGAVTFTNVAISASPATAVTSTINATTNVGAATTSLLGINLAYWDDQETTAQTQQMVTAAGLALYRFPGGSASDDFHFNVSNNYGDSVANTIPQFAQFISAVGGAGIVTLDYGSGSPQEAAAELAYLQGSPSDTTSIGTGLEWNDNTNQWQSVNWGTVGSWASLRAASPLGTNDGLNFMRINHPVPFTNIKYWEVGNEEYGSWEIDHHGTPGPGGASTGAQHDPATYAAFAKQFATLASEIVTSAGLPAISIGIDSADPTGASDNNWTKNVLTDGLSIGFVPGFISDHSYMQGPGDESDSFLLNDSVSDPGSILDWSTRYADYHSLLQQTLSSQASSVVVMATEFNSVYTNPGKQSTSLVNGLFIANSIGSLLDSGYQGGVAWDLRNSWETDNNNSNSLYGWREGGDYGQLGDPNINDPPSTGAYIAYPGYFALQLASKIDVNGGEVVSASSNNADLDVYAVKEANGHLDLLVINTNPAASLTDQFSVTGFQPSGSAQVWQYGETQDTAQSHTTNGASALANSTTTLSVSGGSFSYTFPQYSMTVLDLAPASTPSTVAGTDVFYSLSTFDGATHGAGTTNASDDAAIDTSKSAYLPGAGNTTFGSVTAYSLGLNGLDVDLTVPTPTNNHAAITASDFIFKLGNNNTPSAWTTLGGANVLTVVDRPGAGVGGSDRIEILFASNSIKDTWLEVRVKGDDAAGGLDTNTGLASTYTFFYGNIPGDTGAGDTKNFAVNSTDSAAVLGHPGGGLTVTSIYDFNKDKSANSTDVSLAEGTETALVLLNITNVTPLAPDASSDADSNSVVSGISDLANTTIQSGTLPAMRLDIPASSSKSMILNSGAATAIPDGWASPNPTMIRSIVPQAHEAADALDRDDWLLDSLLFELGLA